MCSRCSLKDLRHPPVVISVLRVPFFRFFFPSSACSLKTLPPAVEPFVTRSFLPLFIFFRLCGLLLCVECNWYRYLIPGILVIHVAFLRFSALFYTSCSFV